MAKYAIFFKFEPAAIKAMMANPSDRKAVVSKLCESAGATLESYYLMFGAWDGFVIADGADSSGAAALSLAVTSSGAFASLETHELIESSDFASILSRANDLTYSPPGS